MPCFAISVFLASAWPRVRWSPARGQVEASGEVAEEKRLGRPQSSAFTLELTRGHLAPFGFRNLRGALSRPSAPMQLGGVAANKMWIVCSTCA